MYPPPLIMRLFSLVNSNYITFFVSLSSAYPSFPIHLSSESNASESILHIPGQMPDLSDRHSLPAEIYLEQDPKTPFYYWKRLPVYKNIAGRQ